jgi:hypothetical protein
MRQMAARLRIDIDEHRWPPGPRSDARADAHQGRRDRPRRRPGAPDRSRRVLQPRHERPVARPPRRRRPRPARRAHAGARARQPHPVAAPRADRLRPPPGGIPPLPKTDRRRRRHPQLPIRARDQHQRPAPPPTPDSAIRAAWRCVDKRVRSRSVIAMGSSSWPQADSDGRQHGSYRDGSPPGGPSMVSHRSIRGPASARAPAGGVGAEPAQLHAFSCPVF